MPGKCFKTHSRRLLALNLDAHLTESFLGYPPGKASKRFEASNLARKCRKYKIFCNVYKKSAKNELFSSGISGMIGRIHCGAVFGKSSLGRGFAKHRPAGVFFGFRLQAVKKDRRYTVHQVLFCA